MPNMVNDQTDESERKEQPSPARPEEEARSRSENCEEKNENCGSDQDTAHVRLSQEDQEPHHCDVDKAQEYRGAADILRPLCEEVILQRNPVDRRLQSRVEQFYYEHQQDARDHQGPLGSGHGDEEGRRDQQSGEQAFLAECILVPKRGSQTLKRIAERVPQALYPGLALEVTFLHGLFISGKQREQLLLRRARYPAAGLPSLVVAVGVHFPSLAVVGQIGLEAFLDDALLDPAVEDREAQLDSPEEIASHPVGAGQVKVFLSAVEEVEDARVLEKPSYDRAHAYVLRQPRDSGTQRTYAAHDQVDFHPRLRSPVERLDHLGFDQGVHFRDDVPGLAGTRVVGFTFDRRQDALVERERRNPEVVEPARAPEPGELLENLIHVLADFLVRRQQSEIRVESRGARMIVARGNMRVAPQPALFAAHHERHLGVRLVPDYAVHHVRADFLELRRPVQIRFLVEAREQLDDDRDLLAPLRSVDQVLHQNRVGAGPIHGLLDRDHAGIVDRLLQEVDHGVERLKRMVQQDVAFPDDTEQIGTFFQLFGDTRDERGKLERGSVDQIGDLHQAYQVHGPVHAVQVVCGQLELLQEKLLELRRDIVRDLEPHGVPEMALRELSGERGAKVLDLLLVQEQVAVAGDPERVRAPHGHALEERLHERLKDRSQQHEDVALARDGFRQLDHSRQGAGSLHDRRSGIAPEGVAALELHGEIQALVEHARKGMRRIESDGRQERDHFPQEIVVQPGALFPGPLRLREEAHAFLRTPRKNFLVEQPILLRDQRMGALTDQGENLRRRRLSGNRYLIAEPETLLQLGDADLEELVQVARQDAQEAQPLQRRKPPVLGLGEHALVESQNGELAREELRLDLARRNPGSLEHGEV